MSREPNIQNVPSTQTKQTASEYLRIVNFIVGLGREGYDTFCKAAQEAGKDVYSELAKCALGITEVTQQQRSHAKNACFMFTYGGTAVLEKRVLGDKSIEDTIDNFLSSFAVQTPEADDADITKLVTDSAPFKFWRPAIHQDLKDPTYQTRDAAGFDIQICEDVTLEPGVVVPVGTGLYVAFPRGMELQIRMRGGSAKRGILLANAPGTVDADYRGEIKLLLVNVTKEAVKLTRGERLCQGVLSSYFQGVFYKVQDVADLGTTQRGEGRFNSTGTT